MTWMTVEEARKSLMARNPWADLRQIDRKLDQREFEAFKSWWSRETGPRPLAVLAASPFGSCARLDRGVIRVGTCHLSAIKREWELFEMTPAGCYRLFAILGRRRA